VNASGDVGANPLGRAHQTLWILTVVMVLTAGGITLTVGASPSPLAGIGFALSSTIFILALILASRVTIALERFRRRARPSSRHEERLPLLARLLRRRQPELGGDASASRGNNAAQPPDWRPSAR
jgi:hypothetical protein